MRAGKRLAATGLAVALLAGAAPASAEAAAFKHYVACGHSQNAKPSHSCHKSQKKGAFFASNRADVFYTICVRFPTGENKCAAAQKAVRGRLFVNKIFSNIPGEHKVTWFVQGKRVGLFRFVVRG